MICGECLKGGRARERKKNEKKKHKDWTRPDSNLYFLRSILRMKSVGNLIGSERRRSSRMIRASAHMWGLGPGWM